ncbi:phage tail tape measure protein [Parabacteroides sp. APC149_11_2_Y6]
MAKLEFKVTANRQPVDDLYKSIDRLEKQVKGLGKTDLGLENWNKQYERFKRELKEKADEIEMLKAKIASFNNVGDRKGLDNLVWQLNTAKNEYYALAQEAANTANTIDQNFKKRIFDASQAVNKFTEDIINQKGTIKEIEVDVRRLGDAYKDAAKNAPMSATSKLSEYNAAKRSLEEERAALFELTQEQARARLSVQDLKNEYALYGNNSGKVTSANEDITGSLKHMILTVAGAGAIKDFISNVLSVAGDFQKMEAVLTNTLGSSSKAKEAMDMLADFGATTPFQVDELTNSYVKLANQGFTPTAEEMRKLGDLASSTGKSFDQLSEAILDAQTGEFERLKEFGIKTSKNGDEVTFSFKEQQTTVKNTASAIREYILSLGNLEGVVGANEKIAATFAGRLSNIQDELVNQFRLFGETFNSELSLGINATAAITKNLDSLIPVIGGVVTAYGSYRAAVLVVNAVQEASKIQKKAKDFLQYARNANIAIAAQKAFNLSSKAMVWPALISLVVGLGAAVYMYAKKTNEATGAQKRYNDAVEESEKSVLSEQRELARLKGELAATVKGSDEYNKVRDEIVSKYGKYNAGLKEEIDNVGLLDTTYQSLTESIQQSFGARQYEKFKQEQGAALDEVMAKNLGKIQDRLYKDLGDEEGARVYTKIRNALLERKELDDEIKSTLNEVQNKGTILADSRVDSYIRNIRDAQAVTDEFDEKARNKFGIGKGENSNNNSGNNTKTTISPNITQEIADTTKKIADLNQQIKDLRNGKGKVDEGKTVEETINAKISELSNAEKALETLTGRDKDAAKKAEDERKKQIEKQKAINEQLLDLRRQNQQAEIDLMAEGSEKKIAQIEFDYDNEIAAIFTKEKEWKDAQDGELTGVQIKEIRGALTNAWVKKEKGVAAVDNEQRDAENKAMDEYLIKYGEYQDKRLAITRKYKDLIAKATTEGEKKSLDKDMIRALSDLDIEANKTTSAISHLFDDMSHKTVADMRTIADEGEKALEFLQNGQWDATAGVRLGISEETFKTLKDSPEELDAIANAIVGIRNEADQCDTSFNKVSNGLKKVFSADNDSIKLKEGLAEIEAGMNEIMQSGQFLSDAFSKLGDSFDSPALKGVAEGLNVAMDAMSSAMDGAKAGAMFGPIGAAAGAAVGAVTSLVSSFAKIHDARNEKRIQRLQDQIEVLDKSYEKLGRSVENAYSTDASNLIDQQNKMLEQQKLLIQQQIAEEEDKKHTDDDRIKEWQDQLDEINETIEDNKAKAQDAIFGADVKSAIDDFANAYVDAWGAGEDRAKSMKDTVKKIIKGVIVEMMKADLAPTVQALRDKIESALLDGIISDYEQSELDRLIEQATSNMDSKYSWADKYLNGDEPDSASREATTKGIASISQDSANAIDGKMSSQLIFLDKTLLEVTGIREQMSFIRELQVRGWEDVRVIRELSGKVSDNTNRIAELSSRIADASEKIEANMSNAARGIQDMKDSGVMLRR